jgi:hypothetical protein
MMSVFWNAERIVHPELVKRTVNSDVYCEQLDFVEFVAQKTSHFVAQ